MRGRSGYLTATFAAALWLAAALPASADPQADSCEGKNPAYCKSDKPAPPPPPAEAKDCEGRNPLYCQPTPAAPGADADQSSAKKQRATVAPDGDDADDAPDSNNPAHNPNQNPNQNPNRKPPRNSGKPSGNSGGK